MKRIHFFYNLFITEAAKKNHLFTENANKRLTCCKVFENIFIFKQIFCMKLWKLWFQTSALGAIFLMYKHVYINYQYILRTKFLVWIVDNIRIFSVFYTDICEPYQPIGHRKQEDIYHCTLLRCLNIRI